MVTLPFFTVLVPLLVTFPWSVTGGFGFVAPPADARPAPGGGAATPAPPTARSLRMDSLPPPPVPAPSLGLGAVVDCPPGVRRAVPAAGARRGAWPRARRSPPGGRSLGCTT